MNDGIGGGGSGILVIANLDLGAAEFAISIGAGDEIGIWCEDFAADKVDGIIGIRSGGAFDREVFRLGIAIEIAACISIEIREGGGLELCADGTKDFCFYDLALRRVERADTSGNDGENDKEGGHH